MKRKLLVMLLAAGMVSATAFAADDTLQRAQTLMQQGKASAAYQILAPRLDQHRGDADYLYTTAVAALDAGMTETAIPLFESAIKLDPENGGAWLDLGRARLASGRREEARLALEKVLALDPPEKPKQVARQLLAAVAEGERALAPRFHAFVEAGAGHDSNINNATGQSQVAVPLFGNALLSLNSTSLKTAADYLVVSAGADVLKPLDETLGLYGAASISARHYAGNSNFDSLAPELRAGVIRAEGRHFVRGGIFLARNELDGKFNRDTSGINADWYYVVGPQDRAGIFGQYTSHRFAATVSTENVDQSLLGATWSHRYDERTEVSATAFAADERAPNRIDGDKAIASIRLGTQYQATDAAQVFASIGWQEGRYRKVNPLFLVERKDRLADLVAGANYRIDKDWTVRGQWTHADNRSNIALNRYGRDDISVVLRREF